MAARYFDVKVEVFSFGFRPRLFGFRRGETDYRVSAILFGGYVKMAGELPSSAADAEPRWLPEGTPTTRATCWQAPLATAHHRGAGPFMNIVLAIGILAGLYMVKYQKVSDADMQAVIGHVAAGSPAAKAGFRMATASSG